MATMSVKAQMQDTLNAASMNTDMKDMTTELTIGPKETNRSTLRKKDLWLPASSTLLRGDSDF